MQTTKDFILDKIAYWALKHKTNKKDGFLADVDLSFYEQKSEDSTFFQKNTLARKHHPDIFWVSLHDIKSMLVLLIIAAIFSAVAYGIIGYYTGHFDDDNVRFYAVDGENYYHSTKTCFAIIDKLHIKSYTGRTVDGMRREGFIPCFFCKPSTSVLATRETTYTLEYIFITTAFVPTIIYFFVKCINWKLNYEWVAKKQSKSQEALKKDSENKVAKKKKSMRFWKNCGLSFIAFFIFGLIQTSLKWNGISLGAIPTVILFAPFSAFVIHLWKTPEKKDSAQKEANSKNLLKEVPSKNSDPQNTSCSKDFYIPSKPVLQQADTSSPIKEQLIDVFNTYHEKILAIITNSNRYMIHCENECYEVTEAMLECMLHLYFASLPSFEKIVKDDPEYENPFDVLLELCIELPGYCRNKDWLWQMESSELSKRTDLYSNYCSQSSQEQIRLNWCITGINQDDWNIPFKVTGLLSDLLTSPHCSDNYENAPPVTDNYDDSLHFQEAIFYPIANEMKGFSGMLTLKCMLNVFN